MLADWFTKLIGRTEFTVWDIWHGLRVVFRIIGKTLIISTPPLLIYNQVQTFVRYRRVWPEFLRISCPILCMWLRYNWAADLQTVSTLKSEKMLRSESELRMHTESPDRGWLIQRWWSNCRKPLHQWTVVKWLDYCPHHEKTTLQIKKAWEVVPLLHSSRDPLTSCHSLIDYIFDDIQWHQVSPILSISTVSSIDSLALDCHTWTRAPSALIFELVRLLWSGCDM